MDGMMVKTRVDGSETTSGIDVAIYVEMYINDIET